MQTLPIQSCFNAQAYILILHLGVLLWSADVVCPGDNWHAAPLFQNRLPSGQRDQGEMLRPDPLATIHLSDRVSEPVDPFGPVEIRDHLLRKRKIVSTPLYRNRVLRLHAINLRFRKHIRSEEHTS